MQVIIDSIKRRFHRDVTADPATHGWVLNLYRAGERYPQTVCDYFPAQYATCAELARSLERHRADEARHTLMYEHAITALGQPVMELGDDDVFNHVIRSHTGESFTIDDVDDADVRRRKLAHFLTHAHFLEKRVARSLEYHRDACKSSGHALRVVDAVLRDEQRHVSYTLEAARELFTSEERKAAIEHHRRAEARANLEFSQRQVRAFVRQIAWKAGVDRQILYRVCGFVMAEAAQYV
jgi:hypothetical protein